MKETMKPKQLMNKFTDETRYGTTFIPEFNGKRLTVENVKVLTSEERDDVAKFLLSFYRERGFPYPILTDDELIREFSALKNIAPDTITEDKVLKLFNTCGISIFKHFAPNFYEVNSGNRHKRPNMLDAFNDDKLLLKVIHNRLIEGGGHNMTGNMLKQGLGNSKVAYKASIFFPLIAKAIYSKFANEGDIVYDYSMGFGQRLLGFLSLPFKAKYVGVDPVKRTVESNQNIFDFYNRHIPSLNKEVDIVCSGSENYFDKQYEGKVGLAFSSPPYFNLERYDDSSDQAYYSGYASFINDWWRKTVENTDRMLKPNGLFLINIKEQIGNLNLGQDMLGVLKEHGYSLIDTYNIQLTRNPNFGRKEKKHKYEPIFVLQRQ